MPFTDREAIHHVWGSQGSRQPGGGHRLRDDQLLNLQQLQKARMKRIDDAANDAFGTDLLHVRRNG
jgi:hypothetical protein